MRKLFSVMMLSCFDLSIVFGAAGSDSDAGSDLDDYAYGAYGEEFGEFQGALHEGPSETSSSSLRGDKSTPKAGPGPSSSSSQQPEEYFDSGSDSDEFAKVAHEPYDADQAYANRVLRGMEEIKQNEKAKGHGELFKLLEPLLHDSSQIAWRPTELDGSSLASDLEPHIKSLIRASSDVYLNKEDPEEIFNENLDALNQRLSRYNIGNDILEVIINFYARKQLNHLHTAFNSIVEKAKITEIAGIQKNQTDILTTFLKRLKDEKYFEHCHLSAECGSIIARYMKGHYEFLYTRYINRSSKSMYDEVFRRPSETFLSFESFIKDNTNLTKKIGAFLPESSVREIKRMRLAAEKKMNDKRDEIIKEYGFEGVKEKAGAGLTIAKTVVGSTVSSLWGWMSGAPAATTPTAAVTPPTARRQDQSSRTSDRTERRRRWKGDDGRP